MNYKNIENKSILDFTDDAALLLDIAGIDIKGSGKGVTKEYYKRANGSELRLFHIRTLARETGNKELLKAAEDALKKVQRKLEEREEKNSGFVID